MLISVFIVPVVSFPQTTTILHRLKILMGHSPHSLHILRIPIIKEWGKAVLRTDRHISQFVDLPAVPLYFGLSLFCRAADISKCLFQYDHLLS